MSALDLRPPVLELSAVEKTYAGGVRAVAGMDLVVRAGELVAIVGPSGSGKSTLLHLVGALDRPTAGTVRIAGQDVARCGDDELAALRGHRIGFVFQQFHLLDGVSARENVELGLLHRGERRRRRRSLARDALTAVGLAHREHHRPGQLSGGERQRVAIARALVGSPAVVLADEPTGNLDSQAGAAIVALLHDLHERGATIVVVTHDRALAASFPRVVQVRDGRIEADGPAELSGAGALVPAVRHARTGTVAR